MPRWVQVQLRHRIVPRRPFAVGLPDGGSVSLDQAGQAEMLKDLYWQGFEGFEREATSLFFGLAREADVVLDIGAYFGYYALLAKSANADSEVHAFEPVPENCTLLRQFVDLNGFDINVHEGALGHVEGTIPFFLPQKSKSALPNTGSIQNRFEGDGLFADKGVRRVDVACRPLDSLGLSPDLVKIDVEEAEISVLQGGRETIERCRPLILMEIIGERSDARDFLIDRGYSAEIVATHKIDRGTYYEAIFRPG